MPWKREQWQYLCLGLILVLLTLLVSCSQTSSPPGTSSTADAPSSQEPSILRIGWKGAPDTLNPPMAFLTDSYTIFNLVYDTMYELALDNSFTPSLADSVTTSPDGKVWTYKIHPGIRWHDGEPLTAHDIAFTYNFYHAHPEFPYLPIYTEQFASVTAPDDATVVITLDTPLPNLDSQLLFMYVLPEHIWAKYAADNTAADYDNRDLVGSGPFKLVGYETNEYVHLAANPDYFGEKAKVDEVVFQTFANADALVQALQTGQVDLITEIPKTALATLRNAPNIKLATGSALSTEISDIFMNQMDPAQCPTADGGECTGHPALRDRTVRLALAHATDKQQIIDVLLLGLGKPGLTLLPDTLTPWYNDSLTDYAFDLAKANQLLDEAGYKDSDGDGVREMPDGTQPLRFRLLWADDTPDAPRMAELVSQSWRQIGIAVEPQTFSADALLALCCPAYDYDIIIWGWTTDPDPNILLKVMTSAAIPNGSNETGYTNPDYDALYQQQATEMDPARRKALVWQMQQMVFADVVYIVPYYAQAAQAYRTDRFTGWLIDQPSLMLEDHASLVQVRPVQ